MLGVVAPRPGLANIENPCSFGVLADMEARSPADLFIGFGGNRQVVVYSSPAAPVVWPI